MWLLEAASGKVEQLLCLELSFLPGHCSRKVALKPDYCRLLAHDDYSVVCPAGNTPRWVSLEELRIRGVRFVNMACLVTYRGKEHCHLQIHWWATLGFYILHG